jgi:acyl-CoA thioesterase FadM
MNRWLRILSTIITAQFRNKTNPDEEISLKFRVWITDVDFSIMNNTAVLAITELGRWDLAVRTGFLKYARRNKLYLPLASISAQFIRPLKRFQKFQLTTQLIYWDEKWIYISHRVIREGKTIAVALAKCAVKKGRELISPDRIIRELNWHVKPKNRPEMIDRFERGESLLMESWEVRLHDPSQLKPNPPPILM